MKHTALTMIAIIVLSTLYGCTTVKFFKNGSTTYPPYNGEVKILDAPLGGVNYEVLGIVSVNRPWDTRYDNLIELMKKTAAQNGANAIVICSNKVCPQIAEEDSSLAAPAIKILPSAYVSQPKPQEVAPPAFTPAPTPTKAQKALVEKGRATLNIQFDTNKAVVKEQYNAELAELADVMKKYGDLDVMIEGHTDSVDTDDFNMKLSQKRADSVKNYLVTNFGIAASRLDTKGYGETRPIADNNTKEGRQANRRVEAAVEYEQSVEWNRE